MRRGSPAAHHGPLTLSIAAAGRGGVTQPRAAFSSAARRASFQPLDGLNLVTAGGGGKQKKKRETDAFLSVAGG